MNDDHFLEDLTKHMTSAIENPGTASAKTVYTFEPPPDWPMTIFELALSLDMPPVHRPALGICATRDF